MITTLERAIKNEEDYDMRDYLANARQIAMQKIQMYQQLMQNIDEFQNTFIQKMWADEFYAFLLLHKPYINFILNIQKVVGLPAHENSWACIPGASPLIQPMLLEEWISISVSITLNQLLSIKT